MELEFLENSYELGKSARFFLDNLVVKALRKEP